MILNIAIHVYSEYETMRLVFTEDDKMSTPHRAQEPSEAQKAWLIELYAPQLLTPNLC